MPVEAAKAVAEAIDSRSAPCAPHVSHSFAAQLIGLYPSREVNDPTTYLAGITALFSAYSEDFVRRVCDPVVGLPASSKWFPAIAEIKAALEAEKTKRDNILFNARWTLAEHARRRSKAEDEAHLKPGTSEERAAAVERIMKAYPINPMEAA